MQRLIHFEVWRWCFFFAGQAPVYFLGEFVVHVCFLFAETLFFKVTFAFYYAVSVKVGYLLPVSIACDQQQAIGLAIRAAEHTCGGVCCCRNLLRA